MSTLYRGNFKNARFTGAHLASSNLLDAEFEGATFDGADLTMTRLDSALPVYLLELVHRQDSTVGTEH